MSDRDDNLKRWAAFAPGECCDFGDLGYSLGIDAGLTYPVNVRPSVDTPLIRAILLSAIIDAIRARGWHYQLESGYRTVQCEKTPHGDGAWHGAYAIWELGNRHKRKRAYAAEPCDALLAAYVQALEATEKK